MMAFVLGHTRIGFCWWDLLALIVLIVVIVVFVKNRKKLVDQEKDLQDELSSLYAGDSMKEETPAQ